MKLIKKNFTLVELIIVCAIIGILVTLLLPSLAKARYKAKLVVCMSNLKQMGTMSYLYTKDYNLRFPRKDLNYNTGSTIATDSPVNWTANQVKSIYTDSRPLYKSMFGHLKKGGVAQCPFNEPNNLEASTNQNVYTNYYFFGGWRYPEENTGLYGVFDKLKFAGIEYDVLASDVLDYAIPNGTWSSHPARYLSPSSTKLIFSTSFSNLFGAVDLNYLKIDGSAKTYQQIKPNDSRFGFIRRTQRNYSTSSNDRIYVPKK